MTIESTLQMGNHDHRPWVQLSSEEQDLFTKELIEYRERLANADPVRMLEHEVGKHLAESLGLPGWFYKDFPRLKHETFQEMCRAIGHANVRWATLASYTDGTSRGQALLSPEGVYNLRSWSVIQLAKMSSAGTA